MRGPIPAPGRSCPLPIVVFSPTPWPLAIFQEGRGLRGATHPEPSKSAERRPLRVGARSGLPVLAYQTLAYQGAPSPRVPAPRRDGSASPRRSLWDFSEESQGSNRDGGVAARPFLELATAQSAPNPRAHRSVANLPTPCADAVGGPPLGVLRRTTLDPHASARRTSFLF